MKKYHYTNTGKRIANHIEFYGEYTKAEFEVDFLDVYDFIGDEINMDCAGASLQRIFEHDGELFLCGECYEDDDLVEVWIADREIMDLEGYIYELE